MESEIKEETLTVSEYANILNDSVKYYEAKVIGKIGENTISSRGHIYFKLKDSQSVINCIISKSKYKLFGVEIQEGIEVVSTVYPNIFNQHRRLSFIVKSIELAGEGFLLKEYEKLREKLNIKGLFDEDRKSHIPDYPNRIGVVTSKTGVAIHDFVSNLGKFGYQIKILDSRLEGQTATEELYRSLRTFRKHNIDLLVIIRGSGSLESFLPFNNEMLVREVADYPVPVITCIGHHVDVPLICLAADKMVSTPTAAANLINESWKNAIHKIKLCENKIFGNFQININIRESVKERHMHDINHNFENMLKQIEHKMYKDLSKINAGLISIVEYYQRIG